MVDQMNIGKLSVTRITDLPRFALGLDFLLPGARLEALCPHESCLCGAHVDFETGDILLGIHSLLLRQNGLTILVDTCVGECKPRERRAEWHNRRASGYLEALARAGLRPEDIDIVLCTHLHADHVGWNTCLENGRWVPTFPNARYIIGRTELAHWQAEEARAPGVANHGVYGDSVLPVLAAGLADLVDSGATVGGHMTIHALPGHTPGQIGLGLRSQEGEVLFCGDAIHSPVQVFFPDWSSRFCSDPEQARATRRRILTEASQSGTILIPAHLRGSLAMRITEQDDGYRPEFL